MSIQSNGNPTVVRTTRGLTVGGTRLTLYQLMDHFKAGDSDQAIAQWYRLSPEQMADIRRYLSQHEAEVEAEHQAVLAAAQEERRYWEQQNRERLEQLENRPLTPQQQAIRDRIDELQERIGRS